MEVSSTRSGLVDRERLALILSGVYITNYKDKIYPKTSNLYYDYDAISNIVLAGEIALMCPKCFEISYARILYSTQALISADDSTNVEPIICNLPKYFMSNCSYCDVEDEYVIQIDFNIANAISLLNQKGFITDFSCEGHDKDGSFGYIMFKGTDILDYVDKLAPTWFVDHDTLTGRYRLFDDDHLTITTVIRSGWFNYEESLSDLWDWVVGLPYKRKG